jgi:hypothetical protein
MAEKRRKSRDRGGERTFGFQCFGEKVGCFHFLLLIGTLTGVYPKKYFSINISFNISALSSGLA